MSRLFVFGDLHGNANQELPYLSKKYFSQQKELTKEDVVVQLGDFGCVWYYPESIQGYKQDLHILNQLAEKSFTLFVVPGNHENYDIINELPVVEKWNGKVYKMDLDKGVIYFSVRGEIYNINGKTIFTFSGATTSTQENRYTYEQYESQEKIKIEKSRYGVHYKTVYEKVKLKNVSFWKQEAYTVKEKENAYMNLEKYNMKVDYVFTHTPPLFFVEEYLHNTKQNKTKLNCTTAMFLDDISNILQFKEWHSGHLHENYRLEQGGDMYFTHYKKAPYEIL